MHTRQQPHPHRPPHSLRNLPLINSPQPRLLPMLNPSHTTTEFTHDAEILILIQGVHTQDIKYVFSHGGRSAPFFHLHGREVVRRVDCSGGPAAELVSAEVPAACRFGECVDCLLPGFGGRGDFLEGVDDFWMVVRLGGCGSDRLALGGACAVGFWEGVWEYVCCGNGWLAAWNGGWLAFETRGNVPSDARLGDWVENGQQSLKGWFLVKIFREARWVQRVAIVSGWI